MAKHTDYEELAIRAFSSHSGKLSLCFRILAYGLLADQVHRCFFTLLPSLLVYAVLADLAQYAVASAIWNWHCFRINNNPKYAPYFWTNFPANAFFYTKVALLAVYLLGRV